MLAFRWLWAWSKVGTPDEGEEQGSVSDGRWSTSQAAGLSSFTKQLHNLQQVTTALNPGMSLFEVINQGKFGIWKFYSGLLGASESNQDSDWHKLAQKPVSDWLKEKGT